MKLFVQIGNFERKIVGSFLQLSLFKKLLIIIPFVLLGWFVYSRFQNNAAQTAQYQTSQAERGTLVVSVSVSGTVQATNAKSVTTGASGVVNEVYVKDGDHVVTGQKIATITLDQDGQQQSQSAYASYLSAQNALTSAQSKMNSLQSALFKANQAFVTDSGTNDPDTDDPKYIMQKADWLQAEADYKNQASVITQAQLTVNTALLSYNQVSNVIYAPIDGVVTDLAIQKGTIITSSTNSSSDSNSNTTSSLQKIATIKTDGLPTISVNLTEIDVPKVKVGNKVTVTFDAFADKTFTGKVISIDTAGTVSSGVTSYTTHISLDNVPDTLYPNMSATANIITHTIDNAILVPLAAVSTQNGQSTVRVMKNNQVETIDVTTGESSDTHIEIISGINEGDTVVTSSVMQSTTTGNNTTSPFSTRGFGGAGGAVRIQR